MCTTFLWSISHTHIRPTPPCMVLDPSITQELLYTTYRPHVKGHGAIDVTASGASLSLSVDIKANKTNGRMWIKCSSCSFDVGDLHIEFHGGARYVHARIYIQTLAGGSENIISRMFNH